MTEQIKKSPIEEVIERATIEFPNPQSKKAMKGLFSYIAEKLSYEIDLNTNKHERFGDRFELAGYEPQLLGVNFSGDMTSPEFGRSSFTGERYLDSYTDCDAIKFFVVPGWSISDYRKEELDIWDNVRKTIDEYFSK